MQQNKYLVFHYCGTPTDGIMLKWSVYKSIFHTRYKSWCTDHRRQTQPVARWFSPSTILPATFTTEQGEPARPLGHSLHLSLFYRLHHTGFGQWPDSVYSTGLLCCTAIWVWIQKRRQAIKQFPPSESHSDPHRGNWRLTPARQRRPQSQTKSLGRLDIREPNQQIIKTYLKYEGFQWSGKICSPDIVSKMLKASCLVLLLRYQQWKKTVIAEQIWQCDLYTQIYTSGTVKIEGWWKAGVNAEWILEQLPFLSKREDLTVQRHDREATKEICKGRTKMTSCQIN